MQSPPSGRRYFYLLQLWEERPDRLSRRAQWRCSLEDPRTGQKHGFASLEALTDFLREQLVSRSQEDHDDR